MRSWEGVVPIERIIELVDEGLTVEAVALRLERSPSTVRARVLTATGATVGERRRASGWHSALTPPEVVRAVLDAYVGTRASIGDVADQIGIGRRLTSEIVKAAGYDVVPYKKYLLPSEVATIVERYRGGESCRQIGVSFGVTEKTVRRALDDAGVERRPVGRPKRS